VREARGAQERKVLGQQQPLHRHSSRRYTKLGQTTFSLLSTSSLSATALGLAATTEAAYYEPAPPCKWMT